MSNRSVYSEVFNNISICRLFYGRLIMEKNKSMSEYVEPGADRLDLPTQIRFQTERFL